MKIHNRLFYRLFLLFLMWMAATVETYADNGRRYTAEQPLVYEDVWDLWPYSFLNEKGEPDGFNVDLIRMLMKEMQIPYVIKLKPSEEAFHDLKNGKSDLMLGLAVGFHDGYGHYSNNAVTLFTQSVVTPKSKPVEIKTFKDLGKDGLRVIVNDSSLCHHLMIDYGWSENAVPDKDIREAIQKVSSREEGQIVWNTLSLKWLLHRYQIDNLRLTPVNMPHGEYKFMSNDQQLLSLLDDTYSKMYTADKLRPLQNKWFYPERLEPETGTWIWYAAGFVAVLLLLLGIYAMNFRIQAAHIEELNARKNRRLALIMETSHVRIWTYDIANNQFSWRNENGQTAYTYSMEEFSNRYSHDDFLRLKEALDQLSKRGPDEDDKEIVLELRAKDVEGGDVEDRDYLIALSVLTRDKHGQPQVILGTKKDVTDERRQQRHSRQHQSQGLRAAGLRLG